MKKTKTLFDQAIEIIEAGGSPYTLIVTNLSNPQIVFFTATTSPYLEDEPNIEYNDLRDGGGFDLIIYTRLLLARELWNDGQEKYWKQGLFK